MPRVDLTGQRFGSLLVLGFSHVDKTRSANWFCRCDCGKEIVLKGNNLRMGNTRSCECLARKAVGDRSRTHGECKSRLYRIWSALHSRCTNDHIEDTFKNYGGRGIQVCDDWKTYETFREWALASGYEDGLSIDRIDVNGNYEPSNCRWATQREQCRNRRNTLWVEFNGYKKPLAEWCDELNLPYRVVYARMKKMSFEDAIKKPIRRLLTKS